MIELPEQQPCEFCEGMAGRDPTWTVIDECDSTVTVINPYQYETGQCCVITKRHVGTLLDLNNAEAAAIIKAAQRVAVALVSKYQPLGVLTFQNNGVYSGQEVPHYHFHVVPIQPNSDWGIGPPQLAVIDGAGRSGERSMIPRVIQSKGDGSGFLWRCCTNQPKECGSAFRRDDPAGRSGSLKRTARFPL